MQRGLIQVLRPDCPFCPVHNPLFDYSRFWKPRPLSFFFPCSRWAPAGRAGGQRFFSLSLAHVFPAQLICNTPPVTVNNQPLPCVALEVIRRGYDTFVLTDASFPPLGEILSAVEGEQSLLYRRGIPSAIERIAKLVWRRLCIRLYIPADRLRKKTAMSGKITHECESPL